MKLNIVPRGISSEEKWRDRRRGGHRYQQQRNFPGSFCARAASTPGPNQRGPSAQNIRGGIHRNLIHQKLRIQNGP